VCEWFEESHVDILPSTSGQEQPRYLSGDLPPPQAGRVHNAATTHALSGLGTHAALARWADHWLVNRRDCYGGYWRKESGDVSPTTRKKTLTLATLARHFSATHLGDIVGLPSASERPDSTAKWLAVDIDAHGPKAEPEFNLRAALHWFDRLLEFGFSPLLLASNGVGGFHVWAIFSFPIPLAAAFAAGQFLIHDWRDWSLPIPPEVFPKQIELSGKGFALWLRAPLSLHHKRPWRSPIWNGQRWLHGIEAAEFLLGVEGSDPAALLTATECWTDTLSDPVRFEARKSLPSADAGDIRKRAIDYLAKIPGAIQGQRGSDPTYLAARVLVYGFDLPAEEALEILLEQFNPKCSPPWSEQELRHKIADANSKPFNRPRGYLRDAPGRKGARP